jgi:hypothetical protein
MPSPLARYFWGYGLSLAVFALWPIVALLSTSEPSAIAHELTYTLFHIGVMPFFVGMSLALIPNDSLFEPQTQQRFTDRWWNCFLAGSTILVLVAAAGATDELYNGQLAPFELADPTTASAKRTAVKENWHDMQGRKLEPVDLNKHKGIAHEYDEALTRANPVNHIPLVNALYTGLVTALLLCLGFWRPLTTFFCRMVPHPGSLARYPNLRADQIVVATALVWVALRSYVDWHLSYYKTLRSSDINPFPFAVQVVVIICVITVQFAMWRVGMPRAEGEPWYEPFKAWIKEMDFIPKAVDLTVVVFVMLGILSGTISQQVYEKIEQLLDHHFSLALMYTLALGIPMCLFFYGRTLIEHLDIPSKPAVQNEPNPA